MSKWTNQKVENIKKTKQKQKGNHIKTYSSND